MTRLRDLAAQCRELKVTLFDQGGAAIDTPDPGAGAGRLFASTLVQADGDVVCFVSERYGEDPDLRDEHRRRTAGWFGDLHETVERLDRAIRAATAWVSALLTAATAGTTWAVSTVGTAVLAAAVTGALVPVLVRQALRQAVARLLR